MGISLLFGIIVRMITSRFRSTIGMALFAISVQAYAQLVGPTVIQRVDPVYGPDADQFVPDATLVKLVIDERGDLYSLESFVGLPDNVVQALSKWKFRPGSKDGKPVAISVTTSIPVRRPLNNLLRSSNRPSIPDEEVNVGIQVGKKLTSETAAKLEQKLKDTGDSAEPRAALLTYASRRIDVDPTAKQLQVQQISWFLRNRPGSAILLSPSAMLFKGPGSFQNAEGYEEIKALWLKRLTDTPDDGMTIGHATYFLRLSDPEIAEKVLLSAIPRMGAAAVWLGELYGLSALGITRLDSVSGSPVEANANLPEAGFGSHARSALNSTDDIRILRGALDIVGGAGGSLAVSSNIPVGYSDFCRELLNHAKTLYPEARASCSDKPSNSTDRVEPGRNTKKTPPQYPLAAKSRGLEGKVVFTAVIGKDGKIKTLELLSSPLVFYESALLAVSTWEYQPYRLNGDPVEVVTELTVNYKLH